MSTDLDSIVRAMPATIKIVGRTAGDEQRTPSMEVAVEGARLAVTFAGDYPDRRGRRNGCVYTTDARVWYVYRTTGGTVVVRLERGRAPCSST